MFKEDIKINSNACCNSQSLPGSELGHIEKGIPPAAGAQGGGPFGVLVVDKPAWFTSFDVIAKLRGILKTRKLGHSGTLDPMATGVLPVFCGGATKAADLQENQTKTYLATLRFGLATDTGDITGNVLETSCETVEEAVFKAVLPSFTGKSLQLPPMYSAVKINGVPLYKLARAGQSVERTPREIEIYNIEYKGQKGHNTFDIEVHCSKGTYIRTLAEAIGEALNCPATLGALRRTSAGGYSIKAAKTLEEIEAAALAGCVNSFIMPVETAFAGWQTLEVSKKEAEALRHGVKLKKNLDEGRYAAYQNHVFLGAVQVVGGQLRVLRLFEVAGQ